MMQGDKMFEVIDWLGKGLTSVCYQFVITDDTRHNEI